MNIYRYKIELDVDGKIKFETGIVCAKSLIEVVEEVIRYFGDKFVAFYMLKMIGDDRFIRLPEDLIKEIEEGWF